MNADDLIHLREGWDFEAKLARGRDGRGEVPRSFWETYSAMANGPGGYILLGARELKDGSLQFEGVPDLDRVEGDLWNTLQNPTKVSANLLQAQQVTRIDLAGCTVLLVEVPMAPRANRPVFLNGSIETGTYLRVHEGDRRLSPERARRLLADSVVGRDAGALDELGPAALDADTVRAYREVFAARRPEHPFLDVTGPDFLEQIGALCRVSDGVAWHPTWAGLWMFGTEQALRRLNPNWHLSYKELPDDPDDARRWLDRVHPDGTWPPNLFSFYRRAMVKLHAGLKTPFRTEAGLYRVDETPVHEALREALINTLVHADQQGTTGIRVLRRRGGFEFINPGLLLVSPDQLWKGGVSEARNPQLQRMFTLLQLGEREGSGGPAMRRAWKAQHWRMPRIWIDAEHQETHLELSTESLLPGEVVDALVARFGDGFTGQDELGRLILTEAEQTNEVDHGQLCALTEAHPREVTLKIQDLLRKDLLLRSPSGKKSVYQRVAPLDESAASLSQSAASLSQSAPWSLSQSGVESLSQSGAERLHQSAPERLHQSAPESLPQSAKRHSKHKDSTHRSAASQSQSAPGSLPQSGGGLHQSAANLSQSAPGSLSQSGGGLHQSAGEVASKRSDEVAPKRPEEVASKRAADALPQALEKKAPDSSAPFGGKKWAPLGLAQRAVLDACRPEFLTLDQIAEAIGRSRTTVRNNYLRKLVRDGLLVLRHPERPNHPDQAYRTADADEGSP